ncbi:MAG: LCP family protein [Prevotella sp.]|nr:LCP family protein [Prevotella sp.]
MTATSVFLFFALRTDSVEQIIKNNQILQVLIVLENEGKAQATNVLLYYPPFRRAAIFDIPGNTGAIYTSLNRVDRIDEIYEENGLNAYRTEIEKILGINIPFSLVFTMEQFSVLTDLLGGLRVLIPAPVDYSDNGRYFLLPSGSILLDGDKIRTYLEYSLPDETDANIHERTQNALLALFTALSENTAQVLSKKHYPRYAAQFRTELDSKGLRHLISEISAIDAERLVPQRITGSLREVDGEMLLFPYFDGQLIKDICKQTINSIISSSEVAFGRTYVLEIQNGTNVQGLARNTGILLQGAGYDVLNMVNADTQDIENTVIIDHLGNAEQAKNLGDFIHCTNIAASSEIISMDDDLRNDVLIDFTVILGKDFDGRYVRK